MLFQKSVPNKGMLFQKSVPNKGMLFQKSVPDKGMLFQKSVPNKGNGFSAPKEHPHPYLRQVPPPGAATIRTADTVASSYHHHIIHYYETITLPDYSHCHEHIKAMTTCFSHHNPGCGTFSYLCQLSQVCETTAPWCSVANDLHGGHVLHQFNRVCWH